LSGISLGQALPLFISSKFSEILSKNQLDTFAKVWDYKVNWFEEPNERRGGWSGVGQVILEVKSDVHLSLFIKKQQNHGRTSLLHPIAGEPTFRREFARLQFLEKNQFGAPHVVFYAESNSDTHQRAILMTQALTDFVPLDVLIDTWWQTASRLQQLTLIKKIASEIRRFHDLGLSHRALYPKHIFVKDAACNPQIAVIDLEKARFTTLLWNRTFFDLAALNRHTNHWRNTQRMAFLLSYLKVVKLNFFEKILCRLIIRRAKR
jgi:hypothetical protein